MEEIRIKGIIDVMMDGIDLLRRRRVPHMLVGALAVAVWGQPRATTDIDLMFHLAPESWEQFKRAASRVGFDFDDIWEWYNPMLRDWVARFHKNRITVDFMAARDAQDQEAMRRRRLKRFIGRRISVVAPDDLIIQKMKAGRPRDLEDALGVFRRSEMLMDLEYLWSWATRFRLDDELAYIIRQASETR